MFQYLLWKQRHLQLRAHAQTFQRSQVLTSTAPSRLLLHLQTFSCLEVLPFPAFNSLSTAPSSSTLDLPLLVYRNTPCQIARSQLLPIVQLRPTSRHHLLVHLFASTRPTPVSAQLLHSAQIRVTITSSILATSQSVSSRLYCSKNSNGHRA